MTSHHVGDEKAVSNHAVEGSTAVKRVAYEFLHVLRQFPACAQNIPGTILEDAAQPLVVRFAEFELRPQDIWLQPECPINDVER